MFNRLKAKDKGLGARLYVFVGLSIFFIYVYAIPFANRGSSCVWFALVLTLCVCFIWLVGRIYIRLIVALLIMAFSVLLTFGLIGTQQTASARINAHGSEGFYLQFTGPDESPPESEIVTALVAGTDTTQFDIYDDVSITYRKISLFGSLRLATFVDSMDSAPVVGAGSRHVTASHAWPPVLIGTLPFLFLSTLYLYKRFHHGEVP